MKIHNREAAFKAVSGSINRNLNDEASDRDVKFFVLPTFDDLYAGSLYKNFQTSEVEDIEIHDVRKLEKLLTNSNLTFLELLYSVEVDTFGYLEIEQLHSMRDKISTINLRSLFNSCFGMYRGQMKDLTTPNSESQMALIEKYGYNTKKAMMSLHFLSFLTKFYVSDFKDFKGAITYRGVGRESMMDIKHGKYSLDEFREMAKSNEEVALNLEQKYYDVPFNKETDYQLKELLRTLVKNHLKTI
ncbi:nucleotidyltransferase domain-containing protein [Paenibacillus sp. 1781tsa1]|uniref:DNA polymerase beta superfamily protein n=1 Tax=Paenibacillus sp. 1781tsa1 TaxID=2953810 RepID=UPI0020A19D04|nr:nucleotidyltransferase domain-containing protein [Paenibacillus sp. 1781tsa1]MCP1184970.1 nucleotidyltransferase domain-containing protein [Paenibacillus sp. 1781tsa1]